MRKLTTEEATQDFEKVHGDRYDYSLVEYVDAKTKVKIICSKHGVFEQVPDSHRKGRGCPLCGTGERVKKTKFSIDKVIEDFKKVHGDKYDYSNMEYVNNTTKVKILCPIHSEFFQTPKHHKTGVGCPKCGIIKRAKTQTLSRDEVIKRFIEVHGTKYDYSLVDYIDADTKVQILCAEHSDFWQLPHSHIGGSGCPECAFLKIGESNLIPQEEIIRQFRDTHKNLYDYSLVQYKDIKTKVKIICAKHGVFWQTPDYHKRNGGCPSCIVGSSRGQIELSEFLKTMSKVQTDYIYDKSTSRREVDCYLPEFNLAVEYDGLWWHSTKYKEPNYHKQKRDELRVVGIDLIRIFEDEWLTKQEQVKNLLAVRLGKSSNKIYARQTRLESISSEEAKDFYNLYHIQGQTRANGVSLCLKHEDKVVAVMTFTQNFSHRGLVQENLQELSRFASSIQVVGGASKLFKALIKLTKAEEVVSYSDNRLFTGKTYEALGFTKEHETRPDYYYVRNNQFTRLHKSNFRHSNLPKMIGDLYDHNLTEKQNAENAGWYQIYNCGLTKWRYKV